MLKMKVIGLFLKKKLSEVFRLINYVYWEQNYNRSDVQTPQKKFENGKD